MLAVDLAFMGTTLMTDWGYIHDKRWSAEEDRGFGELFMYVQELGLIALCLMLWKRTHQAFTLVWAGAFLFLFMDDAFRMHETFGHIFDDWTQIERRGTMRAQDYGELLAWVPFLILGAGLVLWSHFRSDKQHRLFLYSLYLLAAALVGLGVCLDVLSRLYNFWGHTTWSPCSKTRRDGRRLTDGRAAATETTKNNPTNRFAARSLTGDGGGIKPAQAYARLL